MISPSQTLTKPSTSQDLVQNLAQINISDKKDDVEAEAELKKELLNKEIKSLNADYQHLENQTNQIEDFTAKTAIVEMGLGLLSMALEGKFNGDNFIYVVNSAFEFISNSTKKLPDGFKKFMLDGAKLFGMKFNPESEQSEEKESPISKIFENNKEKVLAMYLKGLSLFIVGLSGLDYLNKRSKPPEDPISHPFKHLSKLASSLIMAIPALPMLGTFSTKRKLADLMLEAKPQDTNAEALKLTGNEDFLCFMEASFLGARKLLTSLFPKHENIMELVASISLSGLSFMNANSTLKECEGLENGNLFKSKFMSKDLPNMIYDGSREALSKLAKLELDSSEKLASTAKRIFDSKEKILQYSS
ncbi:MAG: hypothetical protein HRT47_07530 [Candidatus Caenarcaniphilales bacterium]|nr:hypothetical protein [Candidatus Caenarcaniphilales bacterium]